MSGRPPEPCPAPEGMHWEVVTERAEWTTEGRAPAHLKRRCRAGASRSTKSCGRPAVAFLNRYVHRNDPPYGQFDSWWAYCEQHLYGRWIENGEVTRWRLRKIG